MRHLRSKGRKEIEARAMEPGNYLNKDNEAIKCFIA